MARDMGRGFILEVLQCYASYSTCIMYRKVGRMQKGFIRKQADRTQNEGKIMVKKKHM